MIGVVDYESGNIASVTNALRLVGAKFIVTSDPGWLAECDGVILPGVGAAPGAMASLRDRGLVDVLRSVRVPFLGICLGMQLLYDKSEEGETECLGIVPGTVAKLGPASPKIPHMGWNRVTFTSPTPLGEKGEGYYYFAHSYAAPLGLHVTGIADCGERFAAAIACHNFAGVQFHPEKSGAAGLALLATFSSLCASSRQ